MQFNIRIGCPQLRPLGLSFLHAVFTEDPVSRFKQRFDPFDRMRFADRDQRHIFRLAPGWLAHARNVGFDFGETGSCTFHMARYRASVERLKPLPHLWLISDARNDAVLEIALRRMPLRSGFIYRHYHLNDQARLARFQALRRIAKSRGHTVILADSGLTATEWGADGIYGPPRSLWPTRNGLLHLATAHDLAEIGLANRLRADAVLLSPVFPTRSHPGGNTLGPARFRLLAARAQAPVIALGGMNSTRARHLRWDRWAAIDGLSG